MRSSALMKPGTLATCRTTVEGELIMWMTAYQHDLRPDEIDEEAGALMPSDVFLILGSCKPTFEETLLTDEWKIGAYLVLSPEGRRGWVGAGWVKPAKPVFKQKRK